MNMGAFSEETKLIWQNLAQLWPKTKFQGCQIFHISFQEWVCGGPKTDFIASIMLDIMSPMSGW